MVSGIIGSSVSVILAIIGATWLIASRIATLQAEVLSLIRRVDRIEKLLNHDPGGRR